MVKLLLILIFSLFWVSSVFAQNKKIVCYVGTWSVYRHGNGKFEVKNINPFLCTHLMYGFFGINEDATVRIIDPYLDLEENWGRGNIKEFNDLKLLNPNLKTIAAVGGWNEGSRKFSQVAANAQLRRRFAVDAREFCLKYKFDGLDLDWEYPAQRDGIEAIDKANFILFLKELRKEFDKSGLLLSAAVASAEFSAEISYDIPVVSKLLDFISVMTYDLHGSWDNVTGLNSPLYAGPADVSDLQRQLNVNACINYWISHGAPREKLILGMALYGRSFTLANVKENGIGVLHNGPGIGGQYSNQPGFIGYNELCERLDVDNWQRIWSEEQQTPYVVKGLNWIGYDDIESITLKAKFALDHNLGGGMVWSLESDDFLGVCGHGRNPLMNAIYSVLNNGQTPSTVPTEATTSTTTTTTQSNTNTTPGGGSGGSSECTQTGIFPDPNNCSKYFLCHDTTKFEYTCPAGLLFDPVNLVCNWPDNVNCKSY
uniref:chitinase n=1 Tax=Corethrella appendiculata TaxID=1370023 RepID=U5EYE2_9DIPT